MSQPQKPGLRLERLEDRVLLSHEVFQPGPVLLEGPSQPLALDRDSQPAPDAAVSEGDAARGASSHALLSQVAQALLDPEAPAANPRELTRPRESSANAVFNSQGTEDGYWARVVGERLKDLAAHLVLSEEATSPTEGPGR